MFPTSRGTVDLTLAIGTRAQPLIVLPFQPDRYPTGTSYRFERDKYLGEEATNKILHDVTECFPECSLYRRGGDPRQEGLYTAWRLTCSYGCVASSFTPENFSPEVFTKIGTKSEPIKLRRHPKEVATARMPNSGMKDRPAKHKPSSTGDVKKRTTSPLTPKRRNLGVRALSPKHRCPFVVSVRNYHDSGSWFLAANGSSLTHANHIAQDPAHRSVRRNDITSVEVDFAKLLYDQGGSIPLVMRILNQLRKNKGKIGQLKKKTLSNLLRKNKLNLEHLQGIDRKWSLAEATIKKLHEMNTSYIALVMDEKDNLLVYKGRGRPSKQETEEIKANGHLKKQLRKVRRELKLQDTSRTLLALSVATNSMIRTMQMFPEVQFIDVAANMNKQKRDVLFSVVKEATGETFIVNMTVMPCGRRWIFQKIYQSFFMFLYGKTTISRIELVLTDDDISSHGALSSVQIMEDCWKNCIHMLCVFHALVMAFHKHVWPLLPHKKNNKYELTKTGKLYCEYTVHFYFIGFFSYYVGTLSLLSQRMFFTHG